MPEPPYTKLKTAYQLHYHFIFGVRRAKAVLDQDVGERATDVCRDVCNQNNDRLLDSRVQDDRLELLLSLQPSHAISRVVQMLKGNLSRILLQDFPQLETQIGRRNLWAGSYRVESVGKATTAAIKAYLDAQYQHHSMSMQAPRFLARFAAPDRKSYVESRKTRHAVHLLNHHLVFSVRDRRHILHEDLALYLTDLVQHICQQKGFKVLALEVAEDHLHTLLAVRPNDTPNKVALALLNNTSYLALRRFEHLADHYPNGQLWMPSYFVRSVGVRTTAQVRSYFKHKPEAIGLGPQAGDPDRPRPSGRGT